MRNIELQTSMKISGKKLKPLLNASTPITIQIREWNLDQLETILTVDSVDDYEKRKKALHQRRRTKNMLLGGVVGGLIANSGDDSIVDGVLLGAAFGAICTSSPEEPKAQVGLLFSDGSHLAVEVNKDEYTQLQTLSVSSHRQDVENFQSAFRDRSLTTSEVNSILNDRATNAFIRRIILAIIIGATPLTLPLTFSFLLNIVGTAQELELPQIIFSILPFIAILGSISLIAGGLSYSQKKELFLIGDKEKEFYSALDVSQKANSCV